MDTARALVLWALGLVLRLVLRLGLWAVILVQCVVRFVLGLVLRLVLRLGLVLRLVLRLVLELAVWQRLLTVNFHLLLPQMLRLFLLAFAFPVAFAFLAGLQLPAHMLASLALARLLDSAGLFPRAAF